MADVELRMSFQDSAALERELAQNLKYGRAFLQEVADAAVLSDCVLIVVHPSNGAELRVPAQIVMVSAEGMMRGTGIEVRPFNPTVLAEIESFVREPPPPAAALIEEPVDAVVEEPMETQSASADDEHASTEPSDDDLARSDALNSDDASASSPEAEAEPEIADDEPQGELDLEPDAQSDNALADGTSIPPDVQLESKQDKLRHLSAADQLKVARKGELSDRLIVERLYGKQVWEALLHNPRITVPEIARIARKGSVPKPLIEHIVENAMWIKAPQVRRALLSNPKVGGDSIMKLLRLTPKHELKLIEKGTAYAAPIREAARKLLKQ